MGRTFEDAPSDLQMMLAELSVSTHGTDLPMRFGTGVHFWLKPLLQLLGDVHRRLVFARF